MRSESEAATTGHYENLIEENDANLDSTLSCKSFVTSLLLVTQSDLLRDHNSLALKPFLEIDCISDCARGYHSLA